jgi:hypothetical protein
MEPDIVTRLKQQEEKLDAIYASVEKSRKYFLILVWVSVLVIILPAIGLLFAIPSFLDTYSSLDGLL